MKGSCLSLRNVSKAFGPNVVLRDVSLDIPPGTVLGLCGENGAGKSTLMRGMAGFLAEDSGSVLYGGAELADAEARRRVCRLVPQEFHLAPQMTVAENLFLGREKRRLGLFVDEEAELAEARRVLARAGAPELDPSTAVGALGVADRQKIEIARALLHRAPVVLFDEPTTVLGRERTEELLGTVRAFRDSGGSALWVSHKLDEVLAVCDEVAVLRDGALVDKRPAAAFDAASLAEAMVGRPLSRLYPPKAVPGAAGSAGAPPLDWVLSCRTSITPPGAVSRPSTTIGPAIVSVESAPGLPRAKSVERVRRTDAARVAPVSLRTLLSRTIVDAGAISNTPAGMPPAPAR